uniref:Uncharacterized protein n=1 Tax=Rhizophora mucronata TaxID=61149 RepID=A0A2P2J6K9_RHIMU
MFDGVVENLQRIQLEVRFRFLSQFISSTICSLLGHSCPYGQTRWIRCERFNQAQW